jgi:hypothetical protein
MEVRSIQIRLSRWLVIAVAFASGFVVAKLVEMRPRSNPLPPIRSLCHVGPKQYILPPAGHAEDETQSARELAEFKKTQLILLHSRKVLSAATANPNVANLPSIKGRTDPAGWLEQRLQVEYPEDGEILAISVPRAPWGEQVALVNAVTDAYLGEVVDVERYWRLRKFKMMKEIQHRYLSELSERRQALRDIRASIDLAAKSPLVDTRASIDEMAIQERMLQRISEYVEELHVELEAPSRVRLFEQAAAP